MDMNTNTNQLYTKNFLIEFEKELRDQLIFSNFVSESFVKVVDLNLIYIIFPSKETIAFLNTKYHHIIELVNKKVFPNVQKIIYIDKNDFKQKYFPEQNKIGQD